MIVTYRRKRLCCDDEIIAALGDNLNKSRATFLRSFPRATTQRRNDSALIKVTVARSIVASNQRQLVRAVIHWHPLDKLIRSNQVFPISRTIKGVSRALRFQNLECRPRSSCNKSHSKRRRPRFVSICSHICSAGSKDDFPSPSRVYPLLQPLFPSIFFSFFPVFFPISPIPARASDASRKPVSLRPPTACSTFAFRICNQDRGHRDAP